MNHRGAEVTEREESPPLIPPEGRETQIPLPSEEVTAGQGVTIPTIVGWVLFALFFAWFWRIYDLFGAIPAYGDALEVVWGIEWVSQQLGAGGSPFFYEGVFHPAGWHTGTLAHTPLLFLIAQPFYWLGNSNFAYNMLAIVPLFITFIGAKRFFGLYTGRWSAMVAALVYTFITTRTNRVHGHLHIYWATAWLPYLAYCVGRWERGVFYRRGAERFNHRGTEDTEVLNRRDAEGTETEEGGTRRGEGAKFLWLRAGVWWGVMINFSLYAVFLAPLTFLLLGRKLFRWRTWGGIVGAGVIALIVGSGALGLFYTASETAGSSSPDFVELVDAGVPLNALWIPSVWHPIEPIRDVANGAFTGTLDESGYANWGSVTAVLAVVGIVMLVWKREGFGQVLFALVALVLSMGLFLRWNGTVVEAEWVRELNQWVWEIGRVVKSDIFVSETMPSRFADGVPLPGFLLTAGLPFYESARIGARFALVGGLGALALAAVALDRMPRWLMIIFAGLWLVETLPVPVTAHPLTADPHPAHRYVADWAAGASRVDVDRYLMHGGEVVWGSWRSGVPSAAIIGSFMPVHTDVIFNETVAPEPERFAAVLRQFDVDYLFVHHRFGDVEAKWVDVANSPFFTLHDCFDPIPDQPIQWRVCVYEVAKGANVDVLPIFGWSPMEAWGVWTIDERPRAEFVAFEQKEHQLIIEAFPHCVGEEVNHRGTENTEFQEMEIKVNGVAVGRYVWEGCETVVLEFGVAADVIRLGMNEVELRLGYAVRPENDSRSLAVGFNRFEIVR